MNLGLLACSYAPREARNLAGHKECWPKTETRTLTQLVAAACQFAEWHEVRVEFRKPRLACPGCGLYLIPRWHCPCWCHETSQSIFRGERGWEHHSGKCWCNGGMGLDV